MNIRDRNATHATHIVEHWFSSLGPSLSKLSGGPNTSLFVVFIFNYIADVWIGASMNIVLDKGCLEI